MNLVRPIRADDLAALLTLAKGAGAGFTSLPPDPAVLQAHIERSLASFESRPGQPRHPRYLFVLEDIASGEVGGCCAIEAACGLDEPFYSYRLGLTVQASQKFGIVRRTPTLYLTNDYTGASVLCSLYLKPAFRGASGAGRLLSKSRFLFVAAHRARFAERMISEMRGVSDERGRSPFWEGLGRHFFSVDYEQAERIVGAGHKHFIAELMPAHPIYASLLPSEAQAVMGEVHAHTVPARRLLESEGFRYQGYVDIFDGGPTLETPTAQVRSVRDALQLELRMGSPLGAPQLIANDRLQEFRCVLTPAAPAGDHLVLDRAAASALNMQAGDLVRVAAP